MCRLNAKIFSTYTMSCTFHTLKIPIEVVPSQSWWFFFNFKFQTYFVYILPLCVRAMYFQSKSNAISPIFTENCTLIHRQHTLYKYYVLVVNELYMNIFVLFVTFAYVWYSLCTHVTSDMHCKHKICFWPKSNEHFSNLFKIRFGADGPEKE